MKKHFFKHLPLITRWTMVMVCLCVVVFTADAQVTIGSSIKPDDYSLLDFKENTSGTATKALHLPRLSTAARNALTATEKTLTKGLAIYNTDANCFEYWNLQKWVSLCTGTANIALSPDNLLPKTIDKDGEGPIGPITPTDDPAPACGNSEPYAISVIAGTGFVSIQMTDPSTGAFTYTVETNDTALPRTAIIRITNTCTGEYKEYIVAQDANDALCPSAPAAQPTVTVTPSSGTICASGGVVYLESSEIAGLANEQYVWSRNGQPFGAGRSITTQQPGTYAVYAGAIGCEQKSANYKSADAVITDSSTAAPKPVVTIDATNSGVICNGSPITLTAYSDPSATADDKIHWYKNGLFESTTGNTVIVSSAGDLWTAVVVNTTTGCASQPSNGVVAQIGSGTPVSFSDADVAVNGLPLNTSPQLCPGTLAVLSIVSPAADYTYTWYVNGSSLSSGGGTSVSYNVPADATLLVISCTASASGRCSLSVTFDSSLSVVRPAKPTIQSSSAYVCSGGSLTLTASAAPAGATYQWYQDGEAIASATSQAYTTILGGNYTVRTKISACESELSDSRVLTLSSAPNVIITTYPASLTPNAQGVVQATGTNVNSYDWSTDGQVSASGNIAIYSWSSPSPAGGNDVTVTATNACGTSSDTKSIKVDYANMQPPTITVLNDATCGTGAIYEISSYADNAILTQFVWTVTRAGANISSEVVDLNGDGKYRRVFIPYNATVSNYVISVVAQGTGKDPSPASSPAQTINSASKGGSGTPAISGSDCYDIKQTNYSTAQYGVWENRTMLVTGMNYTYTASGIGTATSYQWIVSDPNGLLTSTTGSTAATQSIQFKTSVLTDADLVNKPTASKTVTLTCIITDASCTYTQSKTFAVGDRDCCLPVTDIENHVYKTRRFGTAGCWMTENLATTKFPDGAAIQQKNNTDGDNLPFYWITGKAPSATPLTATEITNAYTTRRGLLYTWVAAAYGRIATVGADITNNPNQPVYQGICPKDWHLPSDYEYNQLEKEIATNYSQYSDMTSAPAAWSTSWETQDGIRGTHGRAMKSTTNSINNSASYGLSKNSDFGWNALLVGYAAGGNTYVPTDVRAMYWTSTSSSNANAWFRILERNNANNATSTGVRRSANTKQHMLSVRCKMNE